MKTLIAMLLGCCFSLSTFGVDETDIDEVAVSSTGQASVCYAPPPYRTKSPNWGYDGRGDLTYGHRNNLSGANPVKSSGLADQSD